MSDGRLGWAALWGIAGIVALLVQAIIKLTPMAWQLRDRELGILELASLVGWVAFNAYSEGYLGFQKAFSPRCIARAQTLRGQRPLFVVLAPLYCMGMIHATRKRLIVSWVLALGIVAIVIFVRLLDQPWRGIIDAGVVVGLTWGLVSLLYYVGLALGGRAMPVPPDLPGEQPAS